MSDSITTFWRWFAAHVHSLQDLYLSARYDRLAEEVNRELDGVDSRLAWEIGAGRAKAFMLTITGEGNPELCRAAEKLVEQAPHLEEWEFCSSRPPRSAPKTVRLPGSGVIFETTSWSFIPIERPDQGRLDLIIVDDQLVRSDPESAMKAVSIYLDQTLGEDTVESWIGSFSLESRAAAVGKKMFGLAELPDYLLWASNREKNPLRKTGIQ